MKTLSERGRGIKLRLPKLSEIADMATIIALGIAFYAFVRPAAVSDYLSAVAQSAAASEQSLKQINSDTGAISQDTAQLAAEIPVWIRFAEVDQADLRQHAFQHGADNLSFKLRNASNSLFSDVAIKVTEPDTGRIFEAMEGLAIPPGEDLKLNVDISDATTHKNLICITALNTLTGRTQTEAREIRREGRGATLLVRTTDWQITDGTPPRKCR